MSRPSTNIRPFGTPTPVVPVAPGQQSAPSLRKDIFTKSDLDPTRRTDRAERPLSIEERMAAQTEELDPQRIAQQNNQHRIDKQMQEANERADRQAARLEEAMGAFSQSVETQNQMNERMLRLEEQRLAAERAANAGPSIEEMTRLEEDEQTAYADVIPVIDKRAALNAHNMANRVVNDHVDPRLQAMEDKLNALETRTQDLTEHTANHFGAQLNRTAQQYGIDLSTVESDRSWIEFEGEISDSLSGTKIKDVMTSALKGQSPRDLDILDRVFQRYAAKRDNRPVEQALPETTGQIRTTPQQTPTDTLTPDMQGVAAEYEQLETYRSQLLGDLRAKRISSADFEAEIAVIEARVEELIPT